MYYNIHNKIHFLLIVKYKAQIIYSSVVINPLIWISYSKVCSLNYSQNGQDGWILINTSYLQKKLKFKNLSDLEEIFIATNSIGFTILHFCLLLHLLLWLLMVRKTNFYKIHRLICHQKMNAQLLLTLLSFWFWLILWFPAFLSLSIFALAC